jgi:hypothetical protein
VNVVRFCVFPSGEIKITDRFAFSAEVLELDFFGKMMANPDFLSQEALGIFNHHILLSVDLINWGQKTQRRN